MKLLIPLWLSIPGIALAAIISVTPFPLQSPLYFPPVQQPADNPATYEGVALGRKLFYEKRLSRDSSLSCASCHRQEYAFSDGGKAFSKGWKGDIQSRNTPALFNLAWQPNFFWDGRVTSLEAQVLHPVRNETEMGLSWVLAAERLATDPDYQKMSRAAFGREPLDSNRIAKALAQFLRSIVSARSEYDKVLAGKARFDSLELAGYEIANDQSMGDCLHCHITDAGVLGTTYAFSNNGLDPFLQATDYKDKGRAAISGNPAHTGQFRIPSLRNVALTAPYMHDGRFQTLEEVVRFYSEGVHSTPFTDSKMQYAHRGGVRLSPYQQKALLAFLHTLTDSALISDPAWAAP